MIPLLWFTLGLVVGFAFLLLVEFVLLLKYWATFESNTIDKKPYIEPQLPPELKDFVRAHPRPLPHQRDEIPTEKCEAVNFLLSFIFKELRDTVPVRRYFLRMLTANFKRLLNTTSVGKVIKRARVQDLDLGKCMPHIGGVTVVRPKNSKFEDQQEVDLAVDVAYKGNWHLTIAADLVFNKSATVSVTVLELTGKLRLALRHFPVPHYSVSFYEEPNLRLEVESVFEGKDVSQLNSIIANQIRRSIRRNWTLPAGKMRFKPLFQQPTEDAEPVVTMFGKPLFVGDLTIEVVGAIDLTTRRSGTKLWCTVSLEDNPDEDNLNKASRGTNVTHEVDIEIVKAGVGGSIGVLFSTAKNECRVEAVIDGQPASGTSLRAGDLISKIDGKKVSNVKTASKLIKAARGRVVLTAVRQETAEPTDEQASAADESGGPDAAHPGGRPERVVRTKAVMESARIFWKEKFSFAVSSVDSTLFLRFYEQRLNKHGVLTGQVAMVGFCKVRLVDAGLFNMAHQAPYRQRYAIKSGSAEHAPDVGLVELVLLHQPKANAEARDPKAVNEGLPEPEEAGEEFGLAAMMRPSLASALGPMAMGLSETISESELDEEDEVSESELDTDDGDEGLADRTESSSASGFGFSRRRTGHELFEELPPAERLNELTQLLNTVQSQIDLEAETRGELEKQLHEAEAQEKRRRIKDNVSASDERRDLLYIRMLKCMSAIQECETSITKASS
eukprot:m.201613 g.201613  ORF g.201613 m.201613 type:complete len:728 (+) comp18424_c0_seq3:491-2674(+)